jgi:mono/diheme cytochrome c family protein
MNLPHHCLCLWVALTIVSIGFSAPPVQVELFEDMAPEKEDSDSGYREQGEKSSGSESFSGNDTTPYDVFEGVKAIAQGQVPERVYYANAFGFQRLPNKYDETGARLMPKGPIVLRATATLTHPLGIHRIVIRTRDDAALYMDGEPIAHIVVEQFPTDGHNPVQPLPELVVPSIKEFAPGNTEKVLAIDFDGKPHTFTLETVVGRGGRRPDLGVLAVAIAGPGDDDFRVLGSETGAVFSDRGWAEYAVREEDYYQRLDAEERGTRTVDESRYWGMRHAYARSWIEENGGIEAPVVGEAIPVSNPIDAFIGRRIELAGLGRIAREEEERLAKAEGRILFHSDIKPILEDNCLKCHGDQEKGELRLDSRIAALKGGESEEPAIVAGEPDKSLLIEMVEFEDMPPKGRTLDEKEIDLLSKWIEQGAAWDEWDAASVSVDAHPTAKELDRVGLAAEPLVGDLAFLRRLSLDTIGVIPSLDEIEDFQSNSLLSRRSATIDRLLEDPRWADHWVPFWQDLLAENPNIVKPNLNNTGAFRWWIHESFLDNKPMDQFVTDLVRMRGNGYVGAAGFGIATQNDSPMAAKAHILSAAFMGIEMKCARCHDAPYQSVTQRELFNIAAMLGREPIQVPASSVVPLEQLGVHNSLVEVTLKPEEIVDPEWPFADLSGPALPSSLMRNPDDPRMVLAERMTAPSNIRFAKTIVNWVWKRYFGKGLVEPEIDWENADVSHPDLLSYLAEELIANDYDLKRLSRLILNSHTYQRGILDGSDTEAANLFAGHSRRRMTAEQVVDSLHLATGRAIESEELNMDQDGKRPIHQFINLGKPRRAWEFTSLSNERDRPSLTLPHAQVYVDALEAFGWKGSRQNPIYERDHEPNVLQPAILSNGIMSQRLTRLTDEHPLTPVAMEAEDPSELVERMFVRTLGRAPDASEKLAYRELLTDGFNNRIISESERRAAPARVRYPYVTWTNHLRSEANEIKETIAREIEAGDPPTRYLTDSWRRNFEDGIWALINSPEMIFVP